MRFHALAPLALFVLNASAGHAAPAPAAAPSLSIPLDCKYGVDCAIQSYVDRDPGPGVKDYRCGGRTYEGHQGIDFRIFDMAAQRAGVKVLAAAPGRVVRLRDGVADVSVRTIGKAAIANQECGNGVAIDHGGGWETQYCHMAKGSLVVKVGDQVARGQPLGRVGLSGNTEFPHVHLTVRHGQEVVDPFAPAAAGGTCSAKGSGSGLWTDAAARTLAYRAGAVLNTGFVDGSVTMEAVEAGGLKPPSRDSGALVAYVRAIGLEAGDRLRLVVTAPDGHTLVDSQPAALDHDKAQHLVFAGARRPAGGWAAGRYVARYTVTRGSTVAVSREFTLAF